MPVIATRLLCVVTLICCLAPIARAAVDDGDSNSDAMLQTIYFAFDSAALGPDGFARLDQTANALARERGLMIAIEGHADSTGPAEYNQRLSEARAATVRDFLLQRGIDSGQLNARGYGESKPIASNGAREGRRLNRRVSLRISERSGQAAGAAQTRPDDAALTPPASTAGAGVEAASTPPESTAGTGAEASAPGRTALEPPASQAATDTQQERFDYNFIELAYFDNGIENAFGTLAATDPLAVTARDGRGIDLRFSFEVSDSVHLFGGFSESNLDLDVMQTVFFPTMEEMGSGFFAGAGHPRYKTRLDLDGDGHINFVDLAETARADNDIRQQLSVALGGDMTTWRLGVGLHGKLHPRLGSYAGIFADYREFDHRVATLFDSTRDFGASQTGIGATAGMRWAVANRLELRTGLAYSPVAGVNLAGNGDNEILSDQTLFSLGAQYRINKRVRFLVGVERDGDITVWRAGTHLSFDR